jgi:hypothetical protein
MRRPTGGAAPPPPREGLRAAASATNNACAMLAPGSVHARRAALPAPLAPVAVVLGVLAMRVGIGALAGLGLDLRVTLLLGELLLVVPGLLLVVLTRAPLAAALAPRSLPGKAVFLSLAAGMTSGRQPSASSRCSISSGRRPTAISRPSASSTTRCGRKGPADALLHHRDRAGARRVRGGPVPRDRLELALAVTSAGCTLLLQAFLFALIHIDPTPGGPPVAYRVPFAFGVGLALGILRLRTGSLAASARPTRSEHDHVRSCCWPKTPRARATRARARAWLCSSAGRRPRC